jgi:hypothetical protein
MIKHAVPMKSLPSGAFNVIHIQEPARIVMTSTTLAFHARFRSRFKAVPHTLQYGTVSATNSFRVGPIVRENDPSTQSTSVAATKQEGQNGGKAIRWRGSITLSQDRSFSHRR